MFPDSTSSFPRLNKFLSCFAAFAIDFVKQHNSLHDYLTIRWRFQQAIRRAAADHFRVWRLTLHLLWPRFIKCVLHRTWREGYHPSIKRIIEQTFQRSIWRLTTLPNGVSELDVPTATKKRKLNLPADQIYLPRGEPSVSPSNSARMITDDDDNPGTDYDAIPDCGDEDLKMFEVPTDNSATAL